MTGVIARAHGRGHCEKHMCIFTAQYEQEVGAVCARGVTPLELEM